MILKEFSKYIQKFNTDIPAVILLSQWLRMKIIKQPQNNAEKIIQKEIAFLKNRTGMFLLMGKSKTGKILLESLYQYALSYDQYKFNKWLHKVKASDFTS